MVSVKKCQRRPTTAMATPQASTPVMRGISMRARHSMSGCGGRTSSTVSIAASAEIDVTCPLG